VILHQNSACIVDSLVACKFVNIAVSEDYFARALTSLTGIDYPTGELFRTGERIWTLERCIIYVKASRALMIRSRRAC